GTPIGSKPFCSTLRRSIAPTMTTAEMTVVVSPALSQPMASPLCWKEIVVEPVQDRQGVAAGEDEEVDRRAFEGFGEIARVSGDRELRRARCLQCARGFDAERRVMLVGGAETREARAGGAEEIENERQGRGLRILDRFETTALEEAL